MTTIAWDGKLLACDSQITFGQEEHTIIKMHKVPDGIAAFSGVYCYAMQIIEWLRGERDAKDYPYPRSGKDEDGSSVIMVTGEKKLFVYEWYSHIPMELTSGQYAQGSGSMAARAAMLCGKNAREAVLIASQIDNSTNSDIYIGDPFTQRIERF